MVDSERIRDLLSELSNALDDLNRYRQSVSRDDLVGDRDRRNMVLHALLVAIQSTIDIAHHLIAEKRLPRPDTYRQAFEILDSAGVVEHGLAEKLSVLASFRNVLVHVYTGLDLSRVHEVMVTDSVALADFQVVVKSLL